MKYINFSNKPIVIPQKNFTFVVFKLFFPIKNDITKGSYVIILNNIINRCNEEIHQQDIFEKELARKGVLSLKLEGIVKGNNAYLLYSFSIPKENIIKDYQFNTTFQFVMNNLFHPYLDNGVFNSSIFKEEQDYFIDCLTQRYQNIYYQNDDQLYKIIDPKEERWLTYQTKIDLLKKASPQELTKLYQDYIINNHFYPIVYGDITSQQVNNLFASYMPFKKQRILKQNYQFSPLLNYEDINFPTNNNQTEVNAILQVPNLTEKETDYLRALYFFLYSRENNLLKKKLRFELKLVYKCDTYYYSDKGIIVLTAYTQLNDQVKVIQGMKDVIKELQDIKTVSICLKRLVTALKMDALSAADDPYHKLNQAMEKIMADDSTEKMIRLYNKISPHLLTNFAKRLQITKIVCFRGEKND
jgi:predicted Zn-dependent peptidase